ncbi:MAG: serine hydrolase [Cyclobacteriaceae bacterium]
MVLPVLTASGQKKSPPAVYYPDANWQHATAAATGFDETRLREAVDFAISIESKSPRNLEVAHFQTFGKEPYGDPMGPFQERGNPTGLIIRNGFVVAKWGDLDRADMTFSVTKSFLSTVVGLAVDRQLIRSVYDTVRPYVAPVLPFNVQTGARAAEQMGSSYFITPFETTHNKTIRWDDLLRQTSDWEGTLWGKPDWADRPSPKPEEWLTRPRAHAGTTYEYNDTRVNVLALAALSVWRRPLPAVLKEYIMDPIGASNTWRWYGYSNSWVVLDGQAIQSVSGGGHFGGGMFINAWDMARFGYLTLRRGKWKDKQLLSEQWIKMALTPTQPEPTYGFMNWFLNTDKKLMADAPASAFVHIGNGTNIIYVDPENDLVVVARWIDSKMMNDLIRKVLAAKK